MKHLIEMIIDAAGLKVKPELLLRKPALRLHSNHVPFKHTGTLKPSAVFDPLKKVRRKLVRLEKKVGKNLKATLVMDRCARSYLNLLARYKGLS